MMMFLYRIVRLFKQKINALLQRAEDPIEILDLLDAEYANDMRKMRKNIAGVLSAEKRLELELNRLRERDCEYEYLGDLQRAYSSVCAQRSELEAIGEQMRARLDALRARRQATRAETIASRALIAAHELMLPLTSAALAREESLEHAHEALLGLRARGQALSELQ
jgi:phage shock protein A